MTMLLIVLSLVARNIYVFAQPTSLELEYTRNVKNSLNKLNVNLTKILLNDSKSEGNFIFSPLNIYGALALVHLGATGTTKNELSNALGLPAEESKLAEAHENLGRLFESIQNSGFDSTKVNIANGVFTRKGLQIKDGYSQATSKYYKSEARQVDFAKAGPEATEIVNKWIADKTRDRIPKLFKNELSKDTVILLASTLYFAGRWKDEFGPYLTKSENFNTGAKVVQVPAMNNTQDVLYLDDKISKFEAVSIPYSYAEFAMLIVLPYRDESVKTLVNSLKPEKISDIISSLKSNYVNYQIPLLKFRWSQDINQYLANLGIKQIFENAELGNLADAKNLKVSKVTHAAEIEINEEGTVASAVTTVQIMAPSAGQYHPDPPVLFRVDRPFLFSIYHQATGIPLFTSVVQNPADQSA